MRKILGNVFAITLLIFTMFSAVAIYTENYYYYDELKEYAKENDADLVLRRYVEFDDGEILEVSYIEGKGFFKAEPELSHFSRGILKLKKVAK